MKSIILLGDGMADEPIEELGGKTPLEVARTPFMDALASRGELGMARTVKPGFPPGSDVANMTVLGIDPGRYYTGRAPIEATSIGVSLKEDDTAFRINLVNLAFAENGLVMGDYSAGHISTGEARELIRPSRSSWPLPVHPGLSGGGIPPPHGDKRVRQTRPQGHAPPRHHRRKHRAVPSQ